jgi:hypothetical protein
MVGLGRFGAGFGLVGFLAIGVVPTSAASAERFHLENGQVVEATVLNGTLNTLTLRVGSIVQFTSLSQIDRVSVTMADGSELLGELLGWKDGVYEMRVAGDVVQVADGRLLNEPDSTEATATERKAEPQAVERGEFEGSPTFVLRNGEAWVGNILHATGSVVMLQPRGLTVTPISRTQIEEIRFKGADGAALSGKFVDWSDGTYRIEVDGQIIRADFSEPALSASNIAVGRPAPVESDAVVAAEAAITASPETTKSEEVISLSADEALVEAPESDAPALDSLVDADNAGSFDSNEVPSAENGVGGPVNETEVAALSNQDGDESSAPTGDGDGDDLHRISTLVEAVDEGVEAVVFRFELSKPAVRPLVVLYAATEASAKAGEDFEAKSGVITFSTGSTYAEVEVPIIDDDQGEDSETFNLFLSGDPKTIEFGQRQIAATINDND